MVLPDRPHAHLVPKIYFRVLGKAINDNQSDCLVSSLSRYENRLVGIVGSSYQVLLRFPGKSYYSS